MQTTLTSQIVSIEQMFNLGQFRPASVQRDFQWGEEQAQRLLHEIVTTMLASGVAADDPSEPEEATTSGENVQADMPPDDLGDEAPGSPDHISEHAASAPKIAPTFYIGGLLLSPGRSGELEIFDGLQRITTLTILIAVLRDLIVEPSLKKRLASAIIADGGQYRLTHPGKDTTLAKMVQSVGQAAIQRQQRSRPDNDAGRRVFDVTRRLRLSLHRRKPELLTALSHFLLQNVQVGIVTTTDQRLARHIFIATNLYGLPLHRDEVFKGELIALASNDVDAAAIEASWNSLREKVGGGLEDFLTTYDMIERRQLQGADCLGDLIDHLRTRAGNGSLMSAIGSLETYADAWNELVGYLRSPHGGPLGNHIWRLKFFKWDEWRPLALHWLERRRTFHGTPNDQTKRTVWRFAELNRRCMAITLYEFGQEARAKMFLDALRLSMRKKPEEPFNSSGTKYLPLNLSVKIRQTIKASLLLPIEDYEVRRSLMLWYEASLWRNDLAPGYIIGGSVEHVLPEKPTLSSQWRRDFPTDEERYLRLHSIGNLALVDQGLNPEMGNSDFVEKRVCMEKHKQFNKYKTAEDIASITQWTPAAIETRAQIAADSIWAALKLPN